MKNRRLFCVLLSLLLLCAALPASALAQTASLDYTIPFVGTWECNFAEYSAYVEEGYSGIVTVEFRDDGTATTYYNGELDDSYGYFTYLHFYIAVLDTGETQTSQFTFSEDGSTLTYTDLEGNWMITYKKVL